MKIYTAPAIVATANVVRETKTIGRREVTETSFTRHGYPPVAVGFYL
jgi:hypothetical protein